MGRKPKPAALAERDGDRRSRIEKLEPIAPVGLGEPPDWMDGYALEGWAQLVREIEPLGIATQADRPLAMVYCGAYAEFRLANDAIGDNLTFEQVTESRSLQGGSKRSTTLKAHPLLPTLRSARAQMIKCLNAFAMSPTSRASLRMEPDDDRDELNQYQDRASQ